MIELRRVWMMGPCWDEIHAAGAAMNVTATPVVTGWWEIWRDLYTRGPVAGFDTPTPEILRMACRAWRHHPVANPDGTPATEDTALRWWNTWHAIYRERHRQMTARAAGPGSPAP